MLAIARMLAGAPRLLLIDEPTEGLAPMIVEELFLVIGQLAREGIPIVLVEQNVRRAIRPTTRYYLIERGRVVAQQRSGLHGRSSPPWGGTDPRPTRWRRRTERKATAAGLSGLLGSVTATIWRLKRGETKRCTFTSARSSRPRTAT